MAQPNPSFDSPTPCDPSPSASTYLPTLTAYRRLLAEITAVPEHTLTMVNIDMISAIGTVLGALPEIRALRPEIAVALPSFDLTRFDKLEAYTLALFHAHSRYRSPLKPQTVQVLVEELTRVRDDLLVNARALARWKLIDGARLTRMKASASYSILASDVAALCVVFHDAWSKIEGKTPYTLADLGRISARSLELATALGARQRARRRTPEATLMRLKAFTLFVRAYGEVRRAVHFRARLGRGRSSHRAIVVCGAWASPQHSAGGAVAQRAGGIAALTGQRRGRSCCGAGSTPH